MSSSSPESSPPAVSVLVLSWNTRALTLACLQALREDHARHPREILVLDNASDDGSASAIAEGFPEVELHRAAHNLGYAIGNNLLAEYARGRYLCLLGSDTEVRPGAIDALVEFLDGSEAHAAAAPRLVSRDGSVQRACMRFPTLAVALVYDMCYRGWPLLRRIDDRYFCRDFDHEHDADVEQPPGTCLVVRRPVWIELGGLDESLWLFFNDVDFCKRLQESGHAIRYLAGPTVLHHGGASTKAFGEMVQTWARNRIAYYRKHHGWFGELLVRGMLRLRGLEEWWALGRRHRDPRHRRDARAELRRILREALR